MEIFRKKTFLGPCAFTSLRASVVERIVSLTKIILIQKNFFKNKNAFLSGTGYPSPSIFTFLLFIFFVLPPPCPFYFLSSPIPLLPHK
ncbi:unnamed protein product [Meloidogyne enterolobii]|uniref:Uncharacterized protein n=1 Tax=Meloidogyne enterolobii TaxID=390850 RepID=A0ACB0YSL4_MELEN